MTQKIGLALGGGGARGLAHFGVMQYLEEQGIEIHCVAGTSMGAIVGAAIASHSWKQLAEGHAQLDWMHLLPLFDISFSGSGLLDGKKALDFLKTYIPERQIEALSIPFAAVAGNLTTRQREIMREGNLFRALRASFAIPGIFTPVIKNNGEVLVDGGIVELVPVITAAELGATDIIAVEVNGMLNSPAATPSETQPLLAQLETRMRTLPIMQESEWGQQLLRWFQEKLTDEKHKPPGMFEAMFDAMDVMQEALMKHQLAQVPPRWLITPEAQQFSIWDYHRAEEIIACGYEAAKTQLA